MILKLTTDQVNQVLSALAQQPYIQVHELINEIQQQGQAQISNNHEMNENANELNQNHEEVAASLTGELTKNGQ